MTILKITKPSLYNLYNILYFTPVSTCYLLVMQVKACAKRFICGIVKITRWCKISIISNSISFVKLNKMTLFIVNSYLLQNHQQNLLQNHCHKHYRLYISFLVILFVFNSLIMMIESCELKNIACFMLIIYLTI